MTEGTRGARRVRGGRWGVLLLGLAAVPSPPASAQEPEPEPPSSRVTADGWDVTVPRGNTREIDFTTTEGTSDRGGQNNLWLMDPDGSNPRAVFQDEAVRVARPRWTPDGQFILVERRRGGL